MSQSHSAGRIEIIARGIVRQGGSVLLCQNTRHGYYYLPGGHVEFGESAAAALCREFVEETGLAAKVGPLLLLTEERFEQRGRPRHELNLMFHVEHLHPPDSDDPREPHTGVVPTLEEGIRFEWVDLAAIPDLDLVPPTAKAFLAAGGRVDGGVGWIASA